MNKKDYYSILGIDKKSSKDEIKKAYRALAMKYHPDKNPGDKQAEDTFKDINEAYEVLSDDSKKSAYDNPSKRNGFHGSGNPGFNGNFHFNFGFDPFMQAAATQKITVDCELEDLYFNRPINITYDRHVHKSGKIPCSKCNGTGNLGVQEGYIELCDVCMGTQYGVQMGTERKTFNLPLNGGNYYRLKGMGNQTVHGMFGDLEVFLTPKKHPFFTKIDANLVCSVQVPLIDFITGNEVLINHFDGNIKMKYKSDGKIVQKYRIQGKGFRQPGVAGTHTKGDLLVEVIPIMPSDINDNEKTLLSELAKSSNFNAQYRIP